MSSNKKAPAQSQKTFCSKTKTASGNKLSLRQLYILLPVLLLQIFTCPVVPVQANSPSGATPVTPTRLISSSVPRGLQVYFASTRLNEGSRSDPSYGGSRHLDLGSGSTEYGTAALRTPPGLKNPSQARTGREYLELLLAGTEQWRKARINFMACFEEKDMLEKVRQCKGKICIYVHGYDKSFEEALQDASMLFADYHQYLSSTDNTFLPIVFSWPSATAISKYQVDKANLEWSKKSFETFLENVVNEKNQDATLDLVCHSMGNQLLFPYLSIEQTKLKRPFINKLFLCSADLDFHAVEERLQDLESAVADLIYILVSDQDRPLIMSQIMHGEPRLGRPFDPPRSNNSTEGADKTRSASTAKSTSTGTNSRQESKGIMERLGSGDFWLQLGKQAAQIYLGPVNTNPPEVLAWLKANPALDREFGAKSRLLDVSELALANMGHALVWPLISSLMSNSSEFPQLKSQTVHKRPDSTYLQQCGGKPRVLYRYTRLDPR